MLHKILKGRIGNNPYNPCPYHSQCRLYSSPLLLLYERGCFYCLGISCPAAAQEISAATDTHTHRFPSNFARGNSAAQAQRNACRNSLHLPADICRQKAKGRKALPKECPSFCPSLHPPSYSHPLPLFYIW